MQIENVPRVGFPTRRALEQQGDLTIGHGLLGKIIVDDQGVFAVVPEPFPHGAACIGRKELHGGRGRGGGSDHDGVIKRAVLLKLPHHVGDGGHFLSNRHVDAGHVLAFLVDDRINRDGRLTDLTVTDDELPLAPAHRDHGVDALQTGLHRLVHGLPCDNARSDLFDRVRFRRA